MKKDNFIILVAFIIGLIVIFYFTDINNSQKNTEQQKETELAPNTQNELAQKAAQLAKENEILRQKLAEMSTKLNTLLAGAPAVENNLQTNNTVNVNNTALQENKNPFGAYQKYMPQVSKMIFYAKKHKIPVTEREEFKNLIKLCGPQVKTVNSDKNMTVIYFKDGYYIKVLKNLVAIYGPKSYHLDFALDGQTTCVGKSQTGYNDCQALGGTEPKANKRIPTWIAYKLPAKLVI